MSKASEIADVVELRAWASNVAFSISSLKEELEAVLPQDDDGETAEVYANEVFEELEARQRLLAESYPFNVDGNTIEPNDLRNNSSYLFCLGLTFFDDIPLEIRTREFESLAKSAAEVYFRGTSVRIGAPWKTGEIVNYPDLLQLVVDAIPDLGRPVRLAAPGAGDGGWDIVVVNNFPDSAFSRIIALGNCATGRTNWHTKGNETEAVYFWDSFAHPPERKNVCLRFLAIPFQASDDQKHRKQCDDCILFDRPRICALAATASDRAMEWLNTHLPTAQEIALV